MTNPRLSVSALSMTTYSRSPAVRTAIAFSVLALACSAVPTTPGEIVVRSEGLSSAGISRTYLITIPPAYSPSRRHSVLIAFHGSGGDADSFQRFTGLDSLSTAYGVLVVYPEAAPGSRGTWALGCAGCTGADQMGIDDYRFATDLVATVAARYSIDPSRVYAAGFSLGGSFVNNLACRNSGLLAGAAVVASLPSADELPGCSLTQPVSMLIMLGDRDPVAPWDGGGQYAYLSASVHASQWADRNRCVGAPTNLPLADRNGDGLRVRLTSYADCAGQTTVRLYRVEGAGHAWTTADLSPTAEIGRQFFGGR